MSEQFHEQLKSCKIHVASSRDRQVCIVGQLRMRTFFRHLHVLKELSSVLCKCFDYLPYFIRFLIAVLTILRQIIFDLPLFLFLWVQSKDVYSVILLFLFVLWQRWKIHFLLAFRFTLFYLSTLPREEGTKRRGR